jgi:CII-binding regulator of phage lambda lysogenization HflD
MRAYEIKRNELKTYENNLGFLSSKSKSGDSMVREMERRIQRIKDDLASIEEKVNLIDSKLAK